jgi:hypothetical protein
MKKYTDFSIFPLSMRDRKILASAIQNLFTGKTASESDQISRFYRLVEAAKNMSLKKLNQLNQQEGTSIGYITAYRGTKTKTDNKNRNSKMIRDLQKGGVKDYYTLEGRYQEEETGKMKAEQTFLLINPSLEAMMEAAEKYEQDSIIFKSKDNVIGMYNRLDGNVYIAKPGSETKSVKEPTDGKHEGYGEAWTRFRNIGLSYDFVWDDPISFDVKNPKPVTVERLESEGFLKKHEIPKETFKKSPDDGDGYKKRKKERGGIDRDMEREKFLNTRVINPETGNKVLVKSLKSKSQDTDAYQYYLKLKDQWEKSLKD